MSRLIVPVALLALAAQAAGQGFTPEEAVKRMKLPDGFTARLIAAEPMIRQPVSISFDSRGRMWVLQYLQYPNYAGLKPLKQDQYLRTIWDKMPEPPPHGPKGADRLTILSDPDENGVYRKSKDFVTGLNIASGFCLGNGGVYVVQPPYLLFYPDKDEDDVPDGDPQVLLTGFGMDDTHSLANSLQWGPDGWLYGAAGSTSTCKIKNPAGKPDDPPVEFQQGIWRYNPATKRFELFSEGGGNTYGLDFDKQGNVIAGTNWGGFACLHQMQGAYYVKGFSKHGPLHNAHTYGYFDHVPYSGFKGGHVTCGGIVYQADAYPPEYRDQYLAANLLSNAVYWHKLDLAGSSFRAKFGGDLLLANDSWFRPVDMLQGPDGSVYVVDFYDRRAAHLDPVDNWDKTNGRVYKIEYKGTPKQGPFDLRKKTSAELVELLRHPNKWWRNEARRLLGERRDASVYPPLRELVKHETGDLALEALWALYVSGGWDAGLGPQLSSHPNEYVRAWAIRLSTDIPPIRPLGWFANSAKDTSPVVLAQLACSARRMVIEDAQPVIHSMLDNPVCEKDPQLPLLIWWVIEDHLTRTKGAGTGWITIGEKPNGLVLITAERYARRLMAGDFETGPVTVARLLSLLPEADKPVALRGLAKALDGRTLKTIPEPLYDPLEKYWVEHPDDPLIVELMARMNVPAARLALRDKVASAKAPDADRVKAAALLAQLRDPKAKVLFLAHLAAAKSDAVKTGLLGALAAFDDPAVADAVLAGYPGWSPKVKQRAVQLLLSRPGWALTLLKRFDKGAFPKADFTLTEAKAAVALDDKVVTALVEKHFGKLAPATAGEKQARIAWLARELQNGGKGDPGRGKVLFTKHCAACHQMHGEGGKVGPDLTTADRKNRMYMLTNIVDPSGYIRPEYVVHSITTTDGRKLSGIVTESSAESLTLVNVINDQVQKTVVPKADVEEMRPSAVSLMPEKLLDTLSYAEIVDLFAYLASETPSKSPVSAKAPPANAPNPPATKKLKVSLVSGSFEYKSDDSLAAFKKYLEANYPVECTLITAKSETEVTGLENLDTADVAVFFTRRLKIDGPALEPVKRYVKSGKPVIGIRTASHGFQNYLQMDKDVFGGDYQGHWGAKEVCTVTLNEAAKGHPVLAGVGPFKSGGSLYKNPNIAADTTVLLKGEIAGGRTGPVAWVRESGGRRVFYTSLGYMDDFKEPNFTRLLVNALVWTTKTELKPAK
jgi:putative membrane-bound dehydrogenase-like protein